MNNLTISLQKLIKIKHHDLTNTSHLVFLDDNTQNLLWQIRLEEIEEKKEFLPVLIFTYDEKEVYQSLYPDKLILYSPGVHWILLPEEFQGEMKIKSSPREVILNYINRIKEKKIEEIEKLFKHDLASEFGAILFAQNLAIKKETVNKIEKQLAEKLKSEKRAVFKNYFTLKGIKTVKTEGIENKHQRKNNLRLLYIDDNSEYGWNAIFLSIFDKVDEISNDIEFDLFLEEMKEDGKLNFPYDLIILDLNLHGEKASVAIEERSGYKVLKKIRDFDLLVSVILFTGSEKSINMYKLKDLGIEDFISKPHPGMNPGEVKNHIDNFIGTLERVEQSRYIHSIWNIYNILLANLKLNDNIENAVFEKIKAVVLKFYNKIFSGSNFTENLRAYEYNEILIYFHSIMTDVVKSMQDDFKITARGSLIEWEDYKQLKYLPDNAKPSFENNWINEFNFKSHLERKILKKFNVTRNHIKPIHGNQVISKDEALYFFVLVVYELVKDNSELKNKVDSNIKEIIKAFAGRKDLYQDMSDLWNI